MFQSGEELQVHPFHARISSGASARSIARRTRSRCRIVCCSNVQGDNVAVSLVPRDCRCGRLLDACGHHRASCSHAGVLSRRGFALESILARICREARGRVRTNLMIRDMDIPVPNVHDGRRLEAWLMGCRSAVGLSWPPTQQWCAPCTETERQGDRLRIGMVLR